MCMNEISYKGVTIMKIGVVHFGCASAGTAQIVRTLVEELSSQGHKVIGIEWDDTEKQLVRKELNGNTYRSFGSGSYVLNAFPITIWNNQLSALAGELTELDQVILLGDTKVNVINLSGKILRVPVSIFNNIEESDLTLGYDTALNSIVENIERVRDTASSLDYGKVRVFNVQIPGAEKSRLLHDTAIAVEAEVVEQVDSSQVARLKQHIKQKEMNNEGYTFFIMDQDVDPVALGEHFGEFDLDWKVVVIDESQCSGPYPTALDRLITNQFKKAIVEWSTTDQPSGQLIIKDKKVELKEISYSEGI
ncbi:hypothetical protein CJ195_02080 [Bacillus sp. UMB0899]|nr:hypothetical protein CJ195_02080 [Bacillus sp. UMB0899]